MHQAIPYIRFSAIHQGKGSSVARQEEMISEWLESNPEFKKSALTYKDLGKSGYKGEHLEHGMGRILAAISEGQIKEGDVVLVEAIDRIGRLEPMDMIGLISQITATGVTIITLEDHQEYSKDRLNTDNASLYILIGKIQQAHDYSKTLSRRINRAYDNKRASAREGKPIIKCSPWWLTSSGKLIPKRAEIVLACIDLYLRKGYGHRKIILELSEQYFDIKGKHPSTLKRWFKHRALIGEWVTNKANEEPIPNVFEPLIDTNKFYQLQQAAKQRTKKMGPSEKYELAGLVKCNQCGAPAHFLKKHYKGNKIIYATCSGYLKRGKVKCTNGASWPYEVVTEIFNRTYWDHLENATSKYVENDKALKLEALKAQLEEINARLDSAIELYQDIPSTNTKDSVSRATIQKEEKQAEIAELEAQLSTFSNDVDLSIFETPDAQVIDDDVESKRQLLQKIGYEILLNGETVTVNTVDNRTITYTRHKRLQKLGCYLFQEDKKMLAYDNDAGHGEPKPIDWNTKIAVNRFEGHITHVVGESYERLEKEIWSMVKSGDYKLNTFTLS